MFKKMMYLVLIIVLGTVSTNYAAVLGDFEVGLDSWAQADATLSQSPIGATLGTQAMQVDGPGGWHISALLDLKSHQAALANPGATITADVTAFEADMTTTWMQVELVINGQNNDDAGANNNIGWQSIGSQDITLDGQAHTVTWELPESLISAIAAVDDNIGWFELALVTNLDEASVIKFYIDNIQLTYEAPEAPTSSVVVGDFEGDLDGWFLRDATLSFSTTGATLGTQAMQVDGPGDWHQNALLDLKSHRLSLSAPGAAITADVTAFDTDMTTTWMNIELVINAQNNDDSGANNNVGWQSLGSQEVILDGQPHTFTWAIPDSLRSVIAGVDDSISWFELVLVTNVDAASVTRFYIDNIQLTYEAPTESPDKSTDVIIGNWEQDLDSWVVSGNLDVLYNDHNGVTLGDYSLDLYLPENGGWNQDHSITLDVMAAGFIENVKNNTKLTVDVTHMVADWPADPVPGWNETVLVINAGGDDWSLWQVVGKLVGWRQTDGDKTATATYDYSQYLEQMNYLESVSYFEFILFTNIDGAYTSSVWFYLDNMKLSGAGVVLEPQPANAATEVPIDTILTWKTGTFAASHHLYFGTDWAKVNDADMDSDPEVIFAQLDDASFDPNGLEFKTKYYWRVDEVNEANPDSPWKGSVWNFTTGNFIVVDDFEEYDAAENRIWYSWHDGLGYGTQDTPPYYAGNGTGSSVGDDTTPSFCEETIVHTGSKSMPFYFNNTCAALISEVEHVWDEPQVWSETAFGSNTLKLYVQGFSPNTAGELYLIIEDSAGISARVTNTDLTISITDEWVEWEISLNDVADEGVNLTAVKKLVIGIANIAGQAAANGRIYIDDIRRHPPVAISIDPDIVLVPKTSAAPVIDGQSEAVWDGVNETQCLITDIINADSAAPEDANDLSATFKTMFDDNNFYIFMEVKDSVIDCEFSDWQGDGVEIYFDGDYSHGESYDGVNDNQIRITVDDVALADIDSSLPVDGTVFKVLLTDSGYNIEASFPLEALQIYPSEDPAPLVDADGVEIPNSGIAPNNIIGFEVQINDNDSVGGRQTMMRWHSDDNGSWGNASLFGQARLVSSTVGN